MTIYDLKKMFREFQDTTLGYGSKFRPLGQLDKVLGTVVGRNLGVTSSEI